MEPLSLYIKYFLILALFVSVVTTIVSIITTYVMCGVYDKIKKQLFNEPKKQEEEEDYEPMNDFKDIS